MAKRAPSELDGAAAFRKRQKLTVEAPVGEDVETAEQLRKLLAFEQDLRRARHGLQSLKKLLDELLSDHDDRPTRFAILQQYLDAVRPRDTSEDAVFLGDIMDMWSFAAQVHDDGVMSSVAVVLALLLQIISGSLQLLPHGLGICQTLLQERQLKSLSRNLSSEKGKGFIISPTLRLLREAVCLDGGAYAKRIFRAREFTFTALARNLEIGHTGEGQEDPRKTSVRTNAVRFVTSCLKYLHSDGRKELLTQKELMSHLTFMMKTDAPNVVLDIVESLKTYVLMDDKIPRDVKFRCFNTKTLTRFLSLSSNAARPDTPEQQVIISDKAHEFLLYICTTNGAGILYPSTGLYPKMTDDQLAYSKTDDAAGLDEDHWQSTFSDGIPVYNFVLSELAQKLRPWSGMKHNELLVAMFKAAPELIADYFFNNRSFTFEPKLSMTWIGYATFLFNTMMIPMPPAFGDRTRYAKIPPPTSILLDNILPLPLNQKVLVRCLSPNSHLTSFFAVRILVVALEKLAAAVKMHKEGFRSSSTVWTEAARRLVDAFCQRIPDMKEVVRSYRAVPADNILHRTMASRLLRLYYEVIPRVALAAKFDVSPLFADVLKRLNDENSEEPETKELAVMELENLVSIASYSPGMRWFAKSESLAEGAPVSPFTALLRVLCSHDRHTPSRQLAKVLATVAVENQLVPDTTKLAALLRALQRLQSRKDGKDMEAVWLFLDNCANRCASSPIKYLDLLEAYIRDENVVKTDGPLALLSVVMAEQLSYSTESAAPEAKKQLAKFLSLYLNASQLSNESNSLAELLHKKISQQFSADSVPMVALGSTKELKELRAIAVETDDEAVVEHSETEHTFLDASKLEEMLHVPLPDDDDEDNTALVKWTTQSVEDLVEDGWAARLMRLLSSQHTHIRKEALTNVLKMAAKIKESSYEEKDQIWLLLCELAESSRAQVDAGPVPSALVAFAIHAVDVLRDPLHPLYPKANSFLTRGPVWSPDKLPLAHDVLHGEPSEDDRYYAELTWLLAYLLDGLRTPADLAVFHRKRWLEKIFALAANPYLRANLRTRVLRILYRATCIASGSTTLATRFGILAWLDARRAAAEGATGDETAVYGALMRRVWDTCDRERVAAWSGGGAAKLVAGLSREE